MCPVDLSVYRFLGVYMPLIIIFIASYGIMSQGLDYIHSSYSIPQGLDYIQIIFIALIVHASRSGLYS